MVRFAYAWLVASLIPSPSLSHIAIASLLMIVPLSRGNAVITSNSMVIVSPTFIAPSHSILS